MQPLRDEVVGGLNQWKTEVLKEPGEYPTTVVFFDTYVDVRVKGKRLDDIPDFTKGDYAPDGMTALADAVGQTIELMSGKVKKKDRALICIVTDGLENSSREYTTKQIKERIEDLTKQGNWTFTYLSASPSAFADGASLGIGKGNTISFVATADGTRQAYTTLARSTSHFSSGPQASAQSFYQQDDEDTTLGVVKKGK
jgi:hypothetical protein